MTLVSIETKLRSSVLFTLDVHEYSLSPSPLRARAATVYGLCNSLKFPVREEVSAQRGQN